MAKVGAELTGEADRLELDVAVPPAEQHFEAVVRIKFGYGPVGSEVGVLVGATDRDGVLATAGVAPVQIGWQYADDRANDAQPRDRSVDRRVAALFAARARQEALKLNRLGDYGEAVMELRRCR